MPCNPNNPKAHDTNYECNPRTNRWIKKKGITKMVNKTKALVKQKTRTTNCNPNNPKAHDTNYECNPRTNRWIKKKAITKMVNKTKALVKQKTKQTNAWQKTCKEMEKQCPMETDLSGDNWCSLEPKNVFYYQNNGKRFCYGVDEIFSIIHLGFTARDTSYEVPPLRLQLPRDSYDRTPFTKDFFIAFKEHIKKHRQVPREPEVAYFLRYFSEFYDSHVIQPFLSQRDPNKVRLSNAIDAFLMKHHDIDIDLDTSVWFWLPNKRPQNLHQYISNQ